MSDAYRPVTAILRQRRGNAKAQKTHCVNGHEFTIENTRLKPNNTRVCRECQRTYARTRQRPSGYWKSFYERRRNPGAGRATKPIAIDLFLAMALAYDGNVCVLWPFARNSAGYAHRRMDGKNKLISRLVCEAKHGPAPTPEHEAAHNCGCGDHGCVTKRHLDWKTKLENEADKLLHGTRLVGAAHPLTKITDDDVREIRTLANTPDRQIAERFDISMAHVASIQRRESRKDVV